MNARATGGPLQAPFLSWGSPLVPARFVERPNRFVVRARVEGDVEGQAGKVVVAHMADPGRLVELLVPGARMGLRPEDTTGGRSTAWTAVIVESGVDHRWVGLHTSAPNRLVRRALEVGYLEEFAGWRLERAEVPYGSSRLDFLLRDAGGAKVFVEAKSVTLARDGVASFPDAPTARGLRHVEELERAVREGHRAAVLFVLQRGDADRIIAARDIDPAFADALQRAESAGVRILGRRCRVGWDGLELGGPVPASAG